MRTKARFQTKMGPEVLFCFFFSQLMRHERVLKVFNGCGHTWDLTLVKGFNRGKKDV